MVLPDELVIGNLYIHDNKWTVAELIKSYTVQDDGDKVVIEIMGEQREIPLEDFCKKFNEINVPELKD